jgi:hypothetical protein
VKNFLGQHATCRIVLCLVAGLAGCGFNGARKNGTQNSNNITTAAATTAESEPIENVKPVPPVPVSLVCPGSRSREDQLKTNPARIEIPKECPEGYCLFEFSRDVKGLGPSTLFSDCYSPITCRFAGMGDGPSLCTATPAENSLTEAPR